MDGSGARQTLLIVGHGMTSHALCRRLADCGATRGALRVVVLGEEPRPAYDRVHLTALLSGKTEADLSLAPAAWYEDSGIELHIGDRVSTIDRDDCLVRTEGGETLLFDRLVLATGSRPFVPPIEGAGLPGVFAYRTVADVQAIKMAAEGAARAAIVGGGLLGLEAADAVRRLGLHVHVIEPSDRILPRQLDATGARLVRARLEALGIHVRTGARVVAIDESSHRGACPLKLVRLDDGTSITTDLVIFAAGIRPRSELARKAELAIAPNGGVVVDDRLTTSDPRIFAVGECAAHRGTTYGLAAPGYRMVDVLVNNLAGGDARFEGASPSARLKLAGVEVAAAGLHDEREAKGAAIHVFVAGDTYRKLVVSDGRIVGALAVGPWDDLPRVEDAIGEPRRFSFWDLRRFRSTGSLFLRSESPPVHLWPDDALVCGCLAVRRGALTRAESAGCFSVDAITARTGAGSVCGSCRPLIADYLLRDRADSVAPSSLRIPVLAPAEELPPTLRCNPEDEIDAAFEAPLDAPDSWPSTPISPSPAGPPAARAAFDTLTSAPEHEAAFALASELVARSLAVAPALEPAPASVPPASSIRASSPVSTSRLTDAPPSRLAEAPPSSRRESMPPLAPISVPERLLPTVPEVHASIAPAAVAGDERARRLLLVSGAVAILATLLTLLLPAVPPARSLGALSLDALVSSHAAREATGYAVVALAILGFSLSLRLRVPRFARLPLAITRAAHGVLGAAALVCLWAHTGLRLGDRSNRALMIDVLAISALGGAAAIATALGGASQAPRARLSRAHVVLFLPLPALLALHVLRAYWF